MSDTVQTINSAGDIDINQHAVIEASAGTGKTYTMVELVLRLMTDEEAGLPLDQILLTTFTDNAANELKTRIRKELKQRLKQGGLSPILTNRFNKAIQNIESAPIYTIHGFCQRMAAEFAFESGDIFDKELVNAKSVNETRFNAFLRTWPSSEVIKSTFADYLAANDAHNLARLKKTVMKLANQINPDFDLIYPPEPAVPKLDDFELTADIAVLESEFLQLYTNKGGTISKHMSGNWKERVSPLLKTLADEELTGEQRYEHLAQVVTGEMDKKTAFEYVFKGVHKKLNAGLWDIVKQKYPLICDQLETIFDLISQIKAAQEFKKAAIVKQCLNYLDRDVSEYLAQQGQVTFDRIIRHLFNLLKSEQQNEQALLTRAIRGKFKVAMIDEFQDTDPYQWHIFKWLFLDKDPGRHRLWVIGDPKQSIYGFRGADVSTYLKARHEMQEAKARRYRLNTNYRSIKPLVNSFNHFFSQQKDPDNPSHWYPQDSITVIAADRESNSKLPVLEQDNSGLSALNFIPLDGENSADSKRTELAEHIAEIIQQRLRGRIKIRLKNEAKILNYDDICILIRSKTDAVFIKNACEALSIPVSIQKSKGLYDQPEAIHFEVILSALHQPHNNGRVHNAQSSLFFNQACVNSQDLSEAEQQKVYRNWLQLLEWARSGEWVAVFDWLVEGSGTRLRALKEGDNRRIANIKKIANTLCEYALQHNAGIAELLRFYKNLRLTADEWDEDSQNQDTDHQSVNVMTMHSAKGLEFPVVFIFAGLTGPSTSKPYHKFYDPRQRATVYDVSKQSKSMQEEADHKEFKQLYYVAMTRAIFKVFLPYVDSESKSISADYKHLILANIDACSSDQAQAEESRPLNTVLAPEPGLILTSFNDAEHSTVPFSQPPEQLAARSRFVHSFSSLSQRLLDQTTISGRRSFGDTDKTPDEPLRDESVIAEQPLIPGGVSTGHVLHGIFEHVDFELVLAHSDLKSLWSDTAIMSVVDEQMQQFRLINQRIKEAHMERTTAQDYREQMAAWIWHTLHKPLPMLNGQSLGSLKPEDRRHELAFHWQHKGQPLTGYIDLLFRIQNRQGDYDYFILDWKSNINAAGYEPEVLADTVMQQHHYDMQYHIYAAAMDTWFQHLGVSNGCLKGALYIFSRGIDCETDDLKGIYYHEFKDLAQQTASIKQQILSLTGS